MATVRQADLSGADAPVVAALLARYLRETEAEKRDHGLPGASPDPLPARYQAEIDDPASALAGSDVLLATDQGRAVGIAVIGGNEIKRLFVSDAARGQGIGARLLAAAIAAIPGEARLTVWCWRDAALRLYQRAGFQQQPSWDERAELVCLSRRG
ncbi:acetyltransferase (GNAT) family protein [Propionicimonas paludicola]|uniref:Acetyltransferase (GNAT) family protein n=1 Tax=Propionicimonas paludicola TaxID=185243 RepID=A0A2A9CT71_9ACTN|nr:GNAT family N-acetyltransferase [Propionicimonas paludicola]PFG17326.1 acetyltransferase (GNAT) family protein [Propionicimonas paludicola]